MGAVWRLLTAAYVVAIAVARIAIVKPDKARALENHFLGLAQKGQLGGKVKESSLVAILEKLEGQSGVKKITVRSPCHTLWGPICVGDGCVWYVYAMMYVWLPLPGCPCADQADGWLFRLRQRQRRRSSVSRCFTVLSFIVSAIPMSLVRP